MNWLDHYRRAERLAEKLAETPMHPAEATRIGAAAQTHALLAQVAVLAQTPFNTHDGYETLTMPTLRWDQDL